jgi:polypeptide N-acetylgalactosaminyltransferase
MPFEYYSLGEIRNIANNQCLDTLKRKNGEKIAVSRCEGLSGNQVFAYTKRKQIVTDDNCLDASDGEKDSSKPIKLIRCHNVGGNQIWEYNQLTNTIIHNSTKLCLDKPNPKKDSTLPLLRRCSGRKSQKWVMSNNFKWQLSNYETNDNDMRENDI